MQSVKENELQELERSLATATPASLALATSQGRWKLPTHLKVLDQTLLWAIESAAARKLDGLIVSMPPQHGKSELCSKYLPAWYLGRFPDRRVILTSYEADFAAQWGRKARDLLAQWGGLFQVQVSRKSAAIHRWDLAGQAGGMTAAGVGGPITGRGAHLLIIDDPIKNDEEARSPLDREKQWEWWQSTASTRLRPGGLSLIVQTRWHRDDLAGRILREAQTNGQRWHELKLTAIAEEGDPLGRPLGAALWPEVYSRDHLLRIQSSRTNYYWRALYQQDPLAEGSTEWPDSYFGPTIWFDEWPRRWECRALALDPSKGRDARFGDYSAIVALQFMDDGTIFVDADMDVRNVSLIIEAGLEWSRNFQPDGFAVEVNQFQELIADEMRRLANQRHQWLPLYTIDNQIPKIVRIRRLTQFLTRGKLKFKRDSAGARLLVRQLQDFPHADHDDGPDALEMGLRLMATIISNKYGDRLHYEVGRTM